MDGGHDLSPDYGYCCESGQGVAEKDAAEAAEWYRRAAEAGDATGACNLGYLYETGEGVEQSWDKAVSCYRQAAELGQARGQYLLGWCYEHGKGVAASTKRARELYEASARQDYKHAVEALERLKDPAKAGEKKAPEKKDRKPEKGGFLKGFFGGKK